MSLSNRKTGLALLPMNAHKLRFVLLPLLSFWLSSAFTLDNQLNEHPSPYLALHGSDPVAWQDLTPSAVDLARVEKKLLYISVGYFSCHWCHVMQQESYQDEKIAAFLNQNYIPVKVDRELEPALDARLIEFAQMTQGQAGWPLNVFLTPDGHPLYAVLYLPPGHFLDVLNKLNQLWQSDQENLNMLAARQTATSAGPGKPVLDEEEVKALVQSVVDQALQMADTLQGGFGQANKFPMVPQLIFLFDQYEQQRDSELQQFLTLTLDRMAENGMYDHVGDGFFRYATDPGWDTPHFEKMLYDNAQLSILYLRASTLFNLPRYERIARRTLDFMQREMVDRTGAMVASFSAVDDQDVEGGYYLWRESELSDLLTEEERTAVQLAWGMDGPAIFEAGYLPKKGIDPANVGVELQSSEAQVNSWLQSARTKLFQARSKRILPVDTKLLAGWNGLALAAFATAARVTGEERYHESARRIRQYIVTELWDGAGLRRAVDRGQALGKSSLEDYAYVAKGLWAWAQLTKKEEDFAVVAEVIDQAWVRFYRNGWRRSETSLIAEEPVRDLIADGAMPSPSAVVADISLRVAKRIGDRDLHARTLAALNSGTEVLKNAGFWYVSQVGAMVAAVAGE